MLDSTWKYFTNGEVYVAARLVKEDDGEQFLEAWTHAPQPSSIRQKGTWHSYQPFDMVEGLTLFTGMYEISVDLAPALLLLQLDLPKSKGVDRSSHPESQHPSVEDPLAKVQAWEEAWEKAKRRIETEIYEHSEDEFKLVRGMAWTCWHIVNEMNPLPPKNEEG